MRAFFFTMHRSGSMVLHQSLMLAAGRIGTPFLDAFGYEKATAAN